MRTQSESGIDDLYAAWSGAFRRQDIDAVVELMTPDYALWAPGAAELDAEGLRPRLKAAFAAYEITSTFECIERLIAGDLAVDRGWDVQQLRPRSGGDTRVHRQRVMLVLRRGSDGAWRFARGITQAGPPG
jgi:ketosteroid isomerase-like protein